MPRLIVRTIFVRMAFGTALALSAATAFAMGSNSSGNIVGKGTPGATAVAENTKTGQHRETTIKESGKYRISSLPIGVWSVVVRQADGSVSEPTLVAVKIGLTTRVP